VKTLGFQVQASLGAVFDSLATSLGVSVVNKVVKYAGLGILLPTGVFIVGAMVYFGFEKSAKEIGGDVASEAAPYVEAMQHADQAVKDSNELSRCTEKGNSAYDCVQMQQWKKATAPGGVLNEALANATKVDANARAENTAASAPPSSAQVVAASVQPTVTVESNLGQPAVSVNVSGRSNPWDQLANPGMIYSAPNDAFPPAIVNLTKAAIASGDKITLKCSGGSTNAGGVPDSGCDGLTQYEPTNNRFQPACKTYYPSNYADKTTYPIYTMQVLGAFATDLGVVVGKPFLVPSKEYSITVPAGATRLQLGMNDCANSDNSESPLTVLVYRGNVPQSATISAKRNDSSAATTSAVKLTVPAPSFDCSKASSVVEKLICSTPELATADAEMATFYKKNIAASGSDSAPIRLGQRAFVAKRNQCSTVACVAEAYRARYEELAQLGYVRG
jgi:uncharacterized protein YecT (DUF1311 family)